MIRNLVGFTRSFDAMPAPLFSLDPTLISQRREKVYLCLAGLFLGTLGIINLLGLSRFVDLSLSFGDYTFPLLLPLGVLPYPITFLCTDIISEFYGKQRANQLVWVGLWVNSWILFLLWLGGVLPPEVPLDPQTHLPSSSHPDFAFFKMRLFTVGSVLGSLIAYLAAQLLDVHLYHFWKKLTGGKHLWLRNNGSTLISQLLDTVIVTSMAFYLTDALPFLPGKTPLNTLFTLILYSYSFKAIIALLDTIPCYMAVHFLNRYFGLTQQRALVLDQ
jgi:uncharacterized integral membrane protein (TIGR00697 family)